MSEMSLEEGALRHINRVFNDGDKWYHGHKSVAPEHYYVATCVGLELEKYRKLHGGFSDGFEWSSKVMGVPSVIMWNDALPSFKAMKSALTARIKYYKGLRT